LFGRPPVNEDEDGTDHPAAAELRAGLTGNDLALVGVVVEDNAELVKVGPAERLADRFCNPVGHTVRMTKAFALDKFIPLLLKGNLVQCFDMDISHHLSSS
jgi:hypothetical protein